MSTYILVHGAFHGGWCWHKIVAGLEARGHRVLAPDLPGHGIDRTPPGEATLAAMTDRVCALIDAEAEPVILVGHSMGGGIITQTAEMRADRIARLVYVAALIPENGQSVVDQVAGDPDTLIRPEAQRPNADGTAVGMALEAVKDIFYGRCAAADVALAQALLVAEGPASAAPLAIAAGNWRTVPRTYVACAQDRAVGAPLQRRLAEAAGCDPVIELDTDHSPFFSMPEALIAALDPG